MEAIISCLHIQGTKREGADTPLKFLSPLDRGAQQSANAASDNVKLREAAAAHPHTPRDVLKHLAYDWEVNVRCWVARNPRVPLMTLQDLLEDEDESVRMLAVWNPQATYGMLEAVRRKDNSSNVRNMVRIVLEHEYDNYDEDYDEYHN